MKKFLSLVLALAMTMSLVTISAGAKDFTDADDITYVEAVEVMAEIGVVDGDTAGNFNATAGLTRGAAAKIICNMILGPTTASALNADAAPYVDVPADSTFAGYIAFCAKENIISGYADGTFKPAAPLTGYAFMKMLLGALGYDKSVEGYEGANWSINVAKRALNIGLDDGLVNDFNGSAYVTREEAMLYAFNTLQATMVEYDTTITIGDITVAGSKASDVEYKDGKYDGNIDRDNLLQFAEKYFTNLKGTPDRDDFYRPATTWKLKAETIGTYTDTPDLTYTVEVKSGDIYKDLGSDVAKADVTVYVDGHKETSKALAIVKGGDDVVGFSGNGVLTEVYYYSDDETAEIVQINTYVGEVDKTVKATDKKDAYIVIADTGANLTAPATNLTYETDEKFDDDTIVLYTYAKDAKEVKSVAIAEVVSGTVTRAENKVDPNEDSQKVTLDGTVYSASAKFAGEEVSNVTVKEDYDLYLDAYGYMIKLERVSELSSDYALVLATEALGGSTISSSFGSNRAKLVFADGTVGVVSTAKNYASGSNQINNGTIVTYKADEDGVYTLRAVKNGTAAGTKSKADSTTFALTNSVSALIVETGTKVYSNSNTTFVIYNHADDDWDAYTGTKNVPTVKATTTSGQDVDVYYYCKTGDMTTVMFIVPGADSIVKNNGNNVLFIAKASASNLIHDNDGDYYEYNAIVKGDITTIKVDATEGKSLNGFYNNYTTDKYGIYDNLTAGVASDTYLVGSAAQAGINKTSADYTVSFGLTSSGTYTYTYTVADDADIYYVDEDGKITESSYNAISKDANDKVFAVVDDGEIVTLVIVEVDDDDDDTVGTGIITLSGDFTIGTDAQNSVVGLKNAADGAYVFPSDADIDTINGAPVPEGCASLYMFFKFNLIADSDVVLTIVNQDTGKYYQETATGMTAGDHFFNICVAPETCEAPVGFYSASGITTNFTYDYDWDDGDYTYSVKVGGTTLISGTFEIA